MVMDSTEFLKLVKECNGHLNTVVSKEEANAISADKWQVDGEPYMWVLTESDGTATVWLDYARGYIALAVNGEVSVDKQIICLGNYIALNPNYYGATGYLHKKVLCQS